MKVLRYEPWIAVLFAYYFLPTSPTVKELTCTWLHGCKALGCYTGWSKAAAFYMLIRLLAARHAELQAFKLRIPALMAWLS
jgi:hypothetical protein